MPDYSKGKIYRLVCNITGKQYVGSTINELYKRRGQHQTEHKRLKEGKAFYACLSVEIFDGGDYEIILVEKYPCADKMELRDTGLKRLSV